MFIDSLFIIILVILLVIFYIFYKINEKFYNNSKFKQYIEVLSCIGALMLAVGVLFQIVEFKQQKNKTTAQNLDNFSKDFIDSIITLFIQHPEMNYFYQELFFNQPIPQNITRNIVLEQQISMSIFSKSIEQIVAIKQNNNYQSMKNTLNKILGNFFKSESFKYYYTHCYKPSVAGPIITSYMQENFGL